MFFSFIAAILIIPMALLALVAALVWSPLGRAMASVLPPILASVVISLPVAWLLGSFHVAQGLIAACVVTAILAWSPLGQGIGDAIKNLVDPARSRKALDELGRRLADAETEIGHLREAAVIGEGKPTPRRGTVTQ